MTDGFLIGLLIKLTASALVVIAATLTAERVGAFAAAMIAALPLSAGPVYLFLTLDHDAAFIGKSAFVSLVTSCAISPFLLAYAALAQRRGLVVSLAGALAVWTVIAVLANHAGLSIAGAFIAGCVSLIVCLIAARRFLAASMPPLPPRSGRDLLLRTLAVVTVAATAILGAHYLGPMASGVAAMAPVVWSSMAIMLHPRVGGPATSAVFANGVGGMVGFTFALTTLAMTVEAWGVPLSLVAALAICVAWGVGLSLARPHLSYYKVRPLP